jgi:ribosomal protein L29
MKKTIYKDQSDKDLMKALYEQRDVLHKFRFGAAGSRTRNVKEGRAAKKEIARIMTELNANKK